MKLTLSLTYDTETCAVTLSPDPTVTLSLGQAMCQEGLYQLAEKRYIAMIQQLQAQAQEAAMRAAITGNAKTREV